MMEKPYVINNQPSEHALLNPSPRTFRMQHVQSMPLDQQARTFEFLIGLLQQK